MDKLKRVIDWFYRHLSIRYLSDKLPHSPEMEQLALSQFYTYSFIFYCKYYLEETDVSR